MVCWEIPEGIVVCGMLETAAVGAECVVCGVEAVLGVPEVLCTTGVPGTARVVVVKRGVAGTEVDWLGVNREVCELWDVEVSVWVMALVVYVTGVDACGGRVPSIVVGRMVPGVVEVYAADEVCGRVCVLGISELGDTEEVESSGRCVEREVCGPDAVGKMEVVCMDVSGGRPVVCVVAETAAVVERCVVCGA